MKSWMAALMWFGIGAGFGICIGMRISERKPEPVEYDEEETYETEEAREALDEYAGYDNISTIEGIERILDAPPLVEITDRLPETATDEEIPEMPRAEDLEIDDGDIHQVHPSQMIPEIITKDEYMENKWEYDKETLTFYEMDEVLYNKRTQEIITNPDDVIGIGTLFEFGGNPKNPTDVIYVKNELFGTLYRIYRLDEAFCDAVDGTCPPQEDEPEEDEFWNDI